MNPPWIPCPKKKEINRIDYERRVYSSRCLLQFHPSFEPWRLTQPVAYEIILPSIHKHLDSILYKSRNTYFKIPHPVSQHGIIYITTAWNKFSIPNPWSIPNWHLVQECLHAREIITQVPLTFLSNVIVLQIKDKTSFSSKLNMQFCFFTSERFHNNYKIVVIICHLTFIPPAMFMIWLNMSLQTTYEFTQSSPPSVPSNAAPYDWSRIE